jgi:hypothetical protein
MRKIKMPALEDAIAQALIILSTRYVTRWYNNIKFSN